MKTETKFKWVNRFEKRVQNPFVRRALLMGIPLPPPWGALLETKGRKTGRPHRNPVIKALVGNQLWLVAEAGQKTDWLRNIEADPRVRVKIGRRWRSGTGQVLADDDSVARARWVKDQLGGWHRLDPLAAPLFWTEPQTVRIDLDGDGDN